MVTPGLQNAVILGTKTAMDLMSVKKGGKGGVVINMSSVSGMCSEYVLEALYKATLCRNNSTTFSTSLHCF